MQQVIRKLCLCRKPAWR